MLDDNDGPVAVDDKQLGVVEGVSYPDGNEGVSDAVQAGPEEEIAAAAVGARCKMSVRHFVL